jgi:hypothetical protein
MITVTKSNKTVLTCGEAHENDYAKLIIEDHPDNSDWLKIYTEDDENVIAFPKKMIYDLREVLNQFDD